jgi:hypothetical protein
VALTVAQSTAAVRDVGIVGALSMAAIPVPAIRRKHTAADLRALGGAKPESSEMPRG